MFSTNNMYKFSTYIFFYIIYCFRSYIQVFDLCQLFFAHGDKLQSNFILLHMAFLFPSTIYLKRVFFSYIACFWLLCQKLFAPYAYGLISGLSILFHWSVCLFFLPIPCCFDMILYMQKTLKAPPKKIIRDSKQTQ